MAVYERVSIGSLAQGAVPPGYTFTRSTTALYIDSDGLLKSAAINTPRRQWDATNRRWGYLAEPQRTNLQLYSNSLATWSSVGGSVAANNALVIGTLSLTSLTEAASTSARSAHNGAITTSIGSAYTMSAFFKNDGLRYLHLRCNDGASNANAAAVVIDTTDGSIFAGPTAYGTFSAATAKVESGPVSGVFVASMTVTVSSVTTTPKIQMSADGSLSGDGQAQSYTGVGSRGIWVGGVQFELGSYRSSLIPTTTATVTRGADLLTRALTGPEGTALSTQGTMVVEFSFLGGDSTADSGNRGAAYLQGATSSDSIFIYNRSSAVGSLIYQASSNQAAPIVSGTAAVGVVQKSAVTWKLNDVQFARNGSHGTRDTTATMPTLTQVAIGGTLTVAGNVLVYAWTISDDHYPTDAGMDALTTPTTNRNQSRLTLGLGLGL